MAQPTKTDVRVTDELNLGAIWQVHGKKFIFGGVLLLGIGFAAYIWQQQLEEKEELATARLSAASDIESLTSVANDYAGQRTGGQALLKIAQLQFDDGKYEEASAVYQRFVAEFPHSELRTAAIFGLASSQEALNNFKAAIAEYKRLVDTAPGNYLVAPAKLGVARCYEVTGKIQEARQEYEELIALPVGTEWQRTAQQRWVVLGREVAGNDEVEGNSDANAETSQPDGAEPSPELSIVPQ